MRFYLKYSEQDIHDQKNSQIRKDSYMKLFQFMQGIIVYTFDLIVQEIQSS